MSAFWLLSLHALFKLRRPLTRIRLPEHIQMLMPYQEKIEF